MLVVLGHWNWLQNFEAQNTYPIDLDEFLIFLFYIDSLLEKEQSVYVSS
jgi:hypothetical protein